jgi:hypothetical protein
MVNTIDYVKENMEFGDFLLSTISNLVKALFTVLPILGAIIIGIQILPTINSSGKGLIALFIAVSTLAWIAWICFGMIDKKQQITSIELWLNNPEIPYEEAIVGGIVAYMVGAISIIIAANYPQIFEVIATLTPLSILPILAFAYMMRNKYHGNALIALSIINGYGFGALLKIAGILLVISIDAVGVPLTALALICEVTFSVFYLYTDLTAWVKNDIESKRSRAKLEEQQEEVDAMREIAARIGRC